MRKGFNIYILSIIVVITFILFMSYRNYKKEVRLNNFIAEFDSVAESVFGEYEVDDNFLSMFEAFNTDDVVAIRPSYIQVLLNTPSVNLVAMAILCFWCIVLYIERKNANDDNKTNYKYFKYDTLKLALMMFNIYNLIFFLLTSLFGDGFSYYSRALFEINKVFAILIVSLIFISNLAVILTYILKSNIFWYISIVGLFEIILIKIFTIAFVLQNFSISSFRYYFPELCSILALGILLYFPIVYLKNRLTEDQKKTILTTSGFIGCGILLLMFLEVF